MKIVFSPQVVRVLLAVTLAIALPNGGGSLSSAVSAGDARDVRAISIADPQRHWQDKDYVEMTPPIRVSAIAGTQTVIYLYLPQGALLQTRQVASQERYSFVLPQGSSVDRVSFSPSPDGTMDITDVRGTRWDDNGIEYFHVLRPDGPEHNATLSGYEWPRENLDAQNTATSKLVELIQSAAAAPVSRRSLARFRMLNRCQSCHVSDKPQASLANGPLPPWPTDGSGLYVPLAVLGKEALLSDSDFFDDPNAGDPFVSVSCNSGNINAHDNGRSRWFTCPGNVIAGGQYDITAALIAGEDHARRVCASRQYLFGHMDETGRDVFSGAMAECGLTTRAD